MGGSSRKLARRRLRSRRVRVVLAAGLVFGVGAFATLAAWTDTENATGSFGSSIFDTESQSAGSPTYASNTTAPGASLTFATPTTMSPGASRYAWLNVRTTPITTVGGTVTLTGILGEGELAPALQYRAVRLTALGSDTTCTSAAFTGSPTFLTGTGGGYLPVSQTLTTPVANPIGAAGAAIGFCFEVQIAPGALNSFQGKTGTVRWTFTATSAT